MPVRLNSSGGGSVTLDVPSTASNFTATIPANTGTVVTTGSTAAVTPTMLAQPLTLATAQNTTSGLNIDFSSIPSWARRVTVIFNGVSVSGSANLLVQLGTSSGLDTTGYVGCASVGWNGAGGGGNTSSVFGFVVRAGSATAASVGSMVIHNVSGNVWVSNHTLHTQDTSVCTFGGGVKTLSGVLDRLRLTTTNGTDTFDAGSVNVMWEG